MKIQNKWYRDSENYIDDLVTKLLEEKDLDDLHYEDIKTIYRAVTHRYSEGSIDRELFNKIFSHTATRITFEKLHDELEVITLWINKCSEYQIMERRKML